MKKCLDLQFFSCFRLLLNIFSIAFLTELHTALTAAMTVNPKKPSIPTTCMNYETNSIKSASLLCLSAHESTGKEFQPQK